MKYGNPDISLDVNFSLSPLQTEAKPLLTLNIGSSQKPLHPKAKSVIKDILENGQYQIKCQDSGQNLAVDILETEDENAELEKLRAQTKQLQNQNAELVQANQEFQVK